MYLNACGWGVCPSICCDPYPFAHSHDLLGPCRHWGCSLWQMIAKAVRSHMPPRCSTWLTSPGSSSFMPSGRNRKLLLSPEFSLFPWVIAEWEKEKERERALADTPTDHRYLQSLHHRLLHCRTLLLITPSPLLVTSKHHLPPQLSSHLVFCCFFYHICLTRCSVIDLCGQNQLAGFSPSTHQTMTLSALWAWDSGSG